MGQPAKSSLRIGYDGRAFSSPAGGVRRYVNGLTSALLAIDADLKLIAIGPDASDLPPSVGHVSADGLLGTNLGWCLDGLPRGCRRSNLSVFHAPAYTAPLWGVHPLVLTIHDVSYERHPEWYPYQRDPLRRAFYRRSALVADRVITDSEFSRQEIHAAYGIDVNRICVIPLGVGAPFTHRPDHHHAKTDPPTIVHVGDLHARRNVSVVVEALAELRRRDGFLNTELVLAGVDRGAAATLLQRAQHLGVSNAIRFVPDADDSTVVELLHRASVVAYPSLYEGFGLPALEALACGAPVVASNAASIPEVVGTAGLLVDPRDVRGWYEALAAVLSSSERSARMRAAGLARAATFTWERTARETLAVYRAVVRSSRD